MNLTLFDSCEKDIAAKQKNRQVSVDFIIVFIRKNIHSKVGKIVRASNRQVRNTKE